MEEWETGIQKQEKKDNLFKETEIVIRSDEDKERDYPQKNWKVMLSIGLTVAIIALVIFLFLSVVGQQIQVEGTSMEGCLNNGDTVYVDKMVYKFSDPKRFDVVILSVNNQSQTYYVKRIIGLPGETVQIVNGYVYINGSQLTSDIYGSEVMTNAVRAYQPITLGEDEYFVLGDNRNITTDSRWPQVGNVHIKQILGKVTFRLYPFSRFGGVS